MTKIFVKSSKTGDAVLSYNGDKLDSIVFNTGAELNQEGADVPLKEQKDVFFTLCFKDTTTATFNTKESFLRFLEK